jgi:hypothetical protein
VGQLRQQPQQRQADEETVRGVPCLEARRPCRGHLAGIRAAARGWPPVGRTTGAARRTPAPSRTRPRRTDNSARMLAPRGGPTARSCRPPARRARRAPDCDPPGPRPAAGPTLRTRRAGHAVEAQRDDQAYRPPCSEGPTDQPPWPVRPAYRPTDTTGIGLSSGARSNAASTSRRRCRSAPRKCGTAQGRMRSRSQLEHHPGELERRHGPRDRSAFVGKLTERGTDEYARAWSASGSRRCARPQLSSIRPPDESQPTQRRGSTRLLARGAPQAATEH